MAIHIKWLVCDGRPAIFIEGPNDRTYRTTLSDQLHLERLLNSLHQLMPNRISKQIRRIVQVQFLENPRPIG